MKVKIGDKVKIIAGKDKGKDGIVTKTLRTEDKIIVQGINVVKKHMKPNQNSETGGILEMEAPIHVSNVKVLEKVAVKKTAKKDIKETKKAK